MSMKCKECPNTKLGYVKSYGRKDAPIVIVGDMPSFEDKHYHKPFTGKVGLLIEEAIAKTNVNFDDILFTNVIHCCYTTVAKIQPEAIQECSKRLFKEIGAYPRTTIITLGKIAAEVILGKKVLIRSMAGTKEGNVWIVEHPVNVLMGNIRKNTFHNSFLRALRNDATEAIEPQTIHITDPTKLPKLRDPIAIDIETTGFSARDDTIIVVGFGNTPELVYTVDEAMVRTPEFKYFLEGATLVFQNGKFDKQFLNNYGINAKVAHDTMLMHTTLTEETGTHSLGAMARQYLGAKEYKSQTIKHIVEAGKKEGITTETLEGLHFRVALDTSYTLQLYYKFDQLMDKIDKRLYNLLLIPAQNMLADVENYGFYVNMDKYNEIAPTIEKEVAELRQKVVDIVKPWQATHEPEINPNSPNQLYEIIYNRMKLKPKKGFKLDTKANTLKSMGNIALPVAIQAYRKHHKRFTTYIKKLPQIIESDGRVHAFFSLFTTVTGRLSSSKPNLQNIPRGSLIRNIFQAPEGKILLMPDYSQAELRVGAHYSKDRQLTLELSDPDKSIHEYRAEDLYGAVYNNEEYTHAKTLNFSVLYNITPFSISMLLGITVKAAAKLIDDWFKSMPRVAKYIRYIRDAAANGHTIITTFGRKRRFDEAKYVGQKAVARIRNQAGNYVFQSVASDITLLAAIQLHELFKNIDKYSTTHIVNLVHDSIIVETEIHLVDEVSKLMSDVMVDVPTQEPLKSKIPFYTETKVAKEWI